MKTTMMVMKTMIKMGRRMTIMAMARRVTFNFSPAFDWNHNGRISLGSLQVGVLERRL